MVANCKSYSLSNPQAVADKIAAAGGPVIDPFKPSGEASAHGVMISWVVVSGQIMVTIESKPWVMPYSLIWENIDHVFAT